MQIFEFLSKHRRSTCEDIASYVIDHKERSRLKTKSVTDDIRKFILNNLLPRKLVKKEGFEKRHNKKIQAYSLDYNGVLYAIRLLSKNKRDSSHPLIILYDESIIQNLAVDYSEYLPFIFDRLKVFKSVLGEHWLDYLKIHDIAGAGLDATMGLVYGQPFPDDFLNDFVIRSFFIFSESISPDDIDMSKMSDEEKQEIFKLYSEEKLSIVKNFEALRVLHNHKKPMQRWTDVQRYLKINDPWGIAITLLIFNNILGKLFWELWNRHNVDRKDPEDIRKETLEKCIAIFKGAPDLWNWYWIFVQDAISTMKNDMKKLVTFSHLVGLSYPRC
ncbi:MAG: hypothetical protein ABI342_04125 [Nitrososphaera sp.]